MTKYLAPFAPAQGPSPSLPSAVTSKPPPTTTSTGSTSSASSSPPVPGYHPTTPPVPDWLPLGSSWLYFSNNGGQTFETGPELGPRGDVFGDVLASPVPGVILLSRAYFGNGDVNEQ